MTNQLLTVRSGSKCGILSNHCNQIDCQIRNHIGKLQQGYITGK
jgi:hypothetical protein